ncbi:small acid-soluble spore protein I (minor) [Caldanaerobius fijiensis DSM 17918]|uniref:Small acid-soluble spore protein I (Minor) n=1 Tax=Caldanaerobius fijiensis DSM 17918 TaxID=1121256 RepID=A0A1M4T7Q8_9THEO|nr:small acid-soluble spore protein SspI [Caldanaerobius fijiensis]SHE40424.1 small acid-soluble spore protein I (minor) [Caldanaerobius fijiensis DSM 17918]
MDIIAAVINNLKGKTKDELRNIIDDAVASKDESTIPGLGVVFSATWKHMSEVEKNQVMDYVDRGLKAT